MRGLPQRGGSLGLPVRPVEGRMIAGVCAAFARSLALDPTWVRIAFVLLALASGAGLLLYGAAWLLLPDERGPLPDDVADSVRSNLRQARGALQTGLRGRRLTRLRESSFHRPAALLAITAGALIILGSVGALSWITPTRALGLGLLALGVAALVQFGNSREDRRET